MKLNAWLGLGLLTLAPHWVVAAPAVDVLSSPAMQSPLALHAALQAITRAGDRLVAVGERGTVLLSDDDGTHWRQAQVPVSSSLAETIKPFHQWSAYALAGLIVLHVAAALKHQFIDRDGLLLRMLPGQRV